MILEEFLEEPLVNRVMTDEDLATIKRLRLQMVYHSYIYYRMDMNIISDDEWQSRANRLAELQKQFDPIPNIGCYDYEFRDWDGTTGMHLPASGQERSMAEYLVDIHEKMTHTTASWRDVYLEGV